MSYLRLNFYIIIIPFWLSFESRVRYVQYWPAVFFSVATIGLLYIIWDAYVTKRGDWWFNDKYLSGMKILGLPFEEILFFVTAPFSCLFIYETMVFLIPLFHVPFNAYVYFALGLVSLTLAWLFRFQNYTRTVMTVVGGTVMILGVWAKPMLASGHFWLAIMISFIPFIIFNGYLTSIPIVRYNPEAITGVRIGTIPIEDFFYNFAMLSSYFWFYILAKQFFSL